MTSLQLANMTTVENSKKKYREEIREQIGTNIGTQSDSDCCIFYS